MEVTTHQSVPWNAPGTAAIVDSNAIECRLSTYNVELYTLGSRATLAPTLDEVQVTLVAPDSR